MVELIIALVLFAVTISFVRYAFLISSTAIRTGYLLARGSIYRRESSPRMFYGGLAFWLLTSLLLIFASYVGIEHALFPAFAPGVSNLLKAFLAIVSAIYVAWVSARMLTTGKVWVRWRPCHCRDRPFQFAWFLGSLLLLLMILMLGSAAMIKRLIMD